MARDRVGSLFLGKVTKRYDTNFFRGHHPEVKVIDIGPDPPYIYRKYIWGRGRK